MMNIQSIHNLLRPSKLISDESALWIVDCFHWALMHFDKEEFYSRTRLIQPSNEFFPGYVASVEEKASNIFQHCLKYTGLQHWPFQLVHSSIGSHFDLVQLDKSDLYRNSQAMDATSSSQHAIHLSYNRQLTVKPTDLASHFSHLLALHLIKQSKIAPPKGVDYIVEAGEILAVFMGFGILMSNSAYTFRGGCGSCYNAQANRQSVLSENELLFALAVFCYLKDIDRKTVKKGLKKHLMPAFKVANRQVVELLRSTHQPLPLASNTVS